MTLFIDGDAFPNLLKPIILRSIERLALPTKVIANKKYISVTPNILNTYSLSKVPMRQIITL